MPLSNHPCRLPCDELSQPNIFSPANSDLPEGTYITASLASALLFADYPDTHPDVNVTNLLISDSTIEDLATDFGYGDTDFDIDFDPPSQGMLVHETVDYTPINLNISRHLTQTILDLDDVTARIMDRVAPSLESFAFLNYIRIWGEYGRKDVPDNCTRTVLDRDFPRLAHLTLRDQQWRFQNLPGRRAFFRSLPSLTRLHVMTSFFPPLSVVRKSVPNATHIRFSGNLCRKNPRSVETSLNQLEAVLRS
ncbi:hypothetical protein DFH09DRAFT_1302617 [Mycena vulgaris]|nr:hypothetical protein DFH09DRAFT_1302617 [Mycena vulgaris]